MKQLILTTSLLLALQTINAQKSSTYNNSESNAKRAEQNAKIAEDNAKKAEANAKIAEQNAKKAEENAKKAEADAVIAEQNVKMAIANEMIAIQNTTKSDDLSKNIIKDLLNDHLISNTNNLNYELSYNKFIVNGKTMEGKVHKIYRDKYKPERGVTIVYYTSSEYSAVNDTKDAKQKKAEENAKKAEVNAIIAEQNALKAEENAKKAEANAIIAEQNAIKAEKNAKKAEFFVGQLVRDLYNDKIITDTSNVTLTYSDEEFIVNGKKIDKKIHANYLKKYPREKGQTISGTRNTKD